MSHEIRTPIATFLAMLDVISQRGERLQHVALSNAKLSPVRPAGGSFLI
jgi:hypothetical protein